MTNTLGTKSYFRCTGADIMARFSPYDQRYSPSGPDEYMALSIQNWISTMVMRAELTAFQQELEVMLRVATSEGDATDDVADEDDT